MRVISLKTLDESNKWMWGNTEKMLSVHVGSPSRDLINYICTTVCFLGWLHFFFTLLYIFILYRRGTASLHREFKLLEDDDPCSLTV